MKEWIEKGIKSLSSMSKPTEKNSAQYLKERAQARDEDPKVRKKLAAKKTTRPEILYYLAGDNDESVRQAVAKNPATPLHADAILAKDHSVDVRMVLAKRLMDLLPHISNDKQSQIYSFTVGALATLARDEILKVRVALSSTLQDKVYAPNVVASRLAKDAEQEVAEPMLRFCVALSDEDLLEIITDHPSPWVLDAIANREVVTEMVSDAIIGKEDEKSSKTLIKNEGARFFDKTLEAIVEKAATIPSFQEPLVRRTTLPGKLAAELATFVDMSLFRYLEKRSDFDKGTREKIVSVVRRRIDFENTIGSDKKDPYEQILALHKKGKITDELIGDALSWRNFDFVSKSLSVLTHVPEELITKVVDMGSPKPIIALCWKANLSMRTAVKIQTDLARVPRKELILARGGTDYPFDRSELKRQLELLGIKASH